MALPGVTADFNQPWELKLDSVPEGLAVWRRLEESPLAQNSQVVFVLTTEIHPQGPLPVRKTTVCAETEES